eukprot:6461531-Amphidinium_carterae.2
MNGVCTGFSSSSSASAYEDESYCSHVSVWCAGRVVRCICMWPLRTSREHAQEAVPQEAVCYRVTPYLGSEVGA